MTTVADARAAIVATIVSGAPGSIAPVVMQSILLGIIDSLDDEKLDVADVFTFKGAWDASAGTFPGAGAAKIGWVYKVSVAGTVNSQFFSVGDDIYAVANNASTSAYANNWLRIEGTITLAEVQAAVGFTFGALAALSSVTASLISDASANGRSLLTSADYSAMRTLLGLVIGTNVQAYDAELAALAGLTSAADKAPYFTGSGAAALTDLTSVARTLINQTTQALMRTTGLGLSANGSSLVSAADYAAMKVLLAITAADITDATANGRTLIQAATFAAMRASGVLNIDSTRSNIGDANATLTASDRTAITTAALTASRTWTLPAANAVNAGHEILVADMQGGVSASNTLIIARAGSDTVNGATSSTIAAAYGAVLLRSDGVSKWTAQPLGTAGGGLLAANNLSDVATVKTARQNLYAAPFDAMADVNLALNGFQQISQENGDTAGTASGYYPADGENVSFSGAMAMSLQRVTQPFTSNLHIPRGVKLDVTTADASVGAGDFLVASSKIEGERLRGLLNWGAAGAAPINIARVIRSNISGRGYLAVRNAAQNRSRIFPIDLVANTDMLFTVNVPGDASGTWAVDNTAGLELVWTFMCGSTYQTTAGSWQAGNYFGASDCTNFAATIGNKVWLGPVTVFPTTGTGLELPTLADIMRCQPGHAEALRQCQRYFQRYQQPSLIGVCASATSIGRASMGLPTQMRAAPTASATAALPVYDGATTSTATITTSFCTVDVAEFDLGGASGLTTGRPGKVYQTGTVALILNARL